MAALHSRQRFLLPALTPSLFNLCVIGFALLAAFNPSLQPGVLVACGVLCGGILQWLAQVPAIRILQREEGEKGESPPMHGQSRRPSAVSPQASLGPPCLNWPFSEPPLWLRSCPSIWPSLFYAERLLEFPLGVLGAAVGMPPRRASRNSRPPKGFPALPVPTKSPRFPFPSPKSPNRLIPRRLFPLPVRPQRHQGDTRRPLAKALGW